MQKFLCLLGIICNGCKKVTRSFIVVIGYASKEGWQVVIEQFAKIIIELLFVYARKFWRYCARNDSGKFPLDGSDILRR